MTHPTQNAPDCLACEACGAVCVQCAIARSIARVRDASARAVLDRAFHAAESAARILAAEMTASSGSLPRAADPADRPDAIALASCVADALGEHDRIIRDAFAAAIPSPKPATAASFTAAHKRNEESPACAYALDPGHTGGLPRARMKVRPSGTKRTGGPANALRANVNGPGPIPADAMASRTAACRSHACSEIRSLVRTYQARRLLRADTVAVRHEITKILATWQDDNDVREAARSEGWIVK